MFQARVVPPVGLAEAITLISLSYVIIEVWQARLNARPRRISFTVEQNILRSTAVQDGHEVGIRGHHLPEKISLDTSPAINILHSP
jgi:hypothetical protein